MNLRLSPSAVAAWRNCPAEFWRKYLAADRWPDHRPYFAQGRVVHKMAEVALKGQLRIRNAGQIPGDPLVWLTDAVFSREWERETKPITNWRGIKPETAREHAYGASRAIVAHVGGWDDVVGIEEKFVVPVTEGVVMPGVIDIRRRTDRLHRIADIKTYSEKEHRYNARYASEQFQPRAYALGAWDMTGNLPDEFQHINVSMRPPYTVTESPVMPLTPFHAMAALATVRITARAIRAAGFPKRWATCSTCPYKDQGVDCLGSRLTGGTR